MIKFYATQLKLKKINIENVPKKLRQEVEKLLKGDE